MILTEVNLSLARSLHIPRRGNSLAQQLTAANYRRFNYFLGWRAPVFHNISIILYWYFSFNCKFVAVPRDNFPLANTEYWRNLLNQVRILRRLDVICSRTRRIFINPWRHRYAGVDWDEERLKFELQTVCDSVLAPTLRRAYMQVGPYCGLVHCW